MIIHNNFQFQPPCSIREDHNKFQSIRGFYGSWQSCWITDRNESNNTWLDHANEHSCHVWSHLLQWFSRRRLKCLRMDDGCQMMAKKFKTMMGIQSWLIRKILKHWLPDQNYEQKIYLKSTNGKLGEFWKRANSLVPWGKNEHLYSGLTKPDEVGEVLPLYQPKLPSLDLFRHWIFFSNKLFKKKKIQWRNKFLK